MKINIFKSFMKSFVIFSLLFTLSCNKNQSTIDSQTQKTASKVLENQLKTYDAKNGSVLIMEVSTGKIKAMVNLTKTDKGNYESSKNDLFDNYSELGSIFMPISLLTAINDGVVDEKTIINTENGQWNYEKQTIFDGTNGGNYKIDDILAHSSNVGMAKIITNHYENQPEKFYKYLQDWKFSEKLDDRKPNTSSPEIINPKDKNWTKSSLASASYGYGLKINAIQITNFYNGIANQGILLKPIFNENQKKEIVVDKIASERSLQILKDALIQSVEKGTLKSNSTKNFEIVGKSGTTRLEFGNLGNQNTKHLLLAFFLTKILNTQSMLQ